MNALGWAMPGPYAWRWSLLVAVAAVVMLALECGRRDRQYCEQVGRECAEAIRWPVEKSLNMADQPPHVANERYRSVSRTLFQLRAALLAAAVVKVYSTRQLAFETLGWLFAASIVIWIGWLVLGLLESEK